VGPQKAGTTWIHNYLQHRRDVSLPNNVKETFFFDRYYDRGLKWYARQFTGQRNAVQVIEVAPTYFQVPAISERVSRDLGRVPIVCTLRDPVARAFSHYVHMLRYGMTNVTFREAASQFPEILDGSRYLRHIARWQKAVGDENVHIVLLEHLRDSPDEYARALCMSLGLEYLPIAPALHEKINESVMSKHYWVARAGWKIATMLRGVGLHQLVETAKGLGMKDFFFGSAKSRSVPTLERSDRDWLSEQLREESSVHERLMRRDECVVA
jgi:hypothetical protein